MSTSEAAPPLLMYAEDDLLVSEDVVVALEGAGFKVVLMANGPKALAGLNEQGPALAALITDVNLGRGPDGWELAHRAREINPALPVVYASGGTEDEWTSKGVPNSIFIAKPFASVQIVVAVSTLLNTGGPA